MNSRSTFEEPPSPFSPPSTRPTPTPNPPSTIPISSLPPSSSSSSSGGRVVRSSNLTKGRPVRGGGGGTSRGDGIQTMDRRLLFEMDDGKLEDMLTGNNTTTPSNTNSSNIVNGGGRGYSSPYTNPTITQPPSNQQPPMSDQKGYSPMSFVPPTSSSSSTHTPTPTYPIHEEDISQPPPLLSRGGRG